MKGVDLVEAIKIFGVEKLDDMISAKCRSAMKQLTYNLRFKVFLRFDFNIYHLMIIYILSLTQVG